MSASSDLSMSLFPVLANPSDPATRENSPSPNSNPSATRILQAALEILLQGESLMEGLSREAYSQRSPLVFQASIGGHYRHCLDHFELAVASANGNPLNYDHRTRDPRLEVDPVFALERTRELRAHIVRIDPADLTREIGVRCEVSYVAGDAPETRSAMSA